MEKDPLVLVFDVGTQSTRALLFDSKGELIAKAKRAEPPYISKNDNRAEKDIDELWRGICAVSKELKEEAGSRWDDVAAVTVTSIRNSLFFLDENCRPTRDAILWMDKREVDCPDPLPLWKRFIFSAVGMGEAVRVQRRTTYTNWVRVNQPDVWERTAKIVMPTAWYNYKFTGVLADSTAGQAAKFPYNYKKRRWMTERTLNYCIFGCPVDKMCRLVEPGDTIGTITAQCSAETGIREGLPLIATGADKACETVGNGAIAPDIASVSLGTAASVEVTTDRYVEPETFMPAYTSVAKGKYNPEIQIFRGFWMVSWFKEQFSLHEKLEAEKLGISAEQLLDEKLSKIPVGSNGLLVQPYWGPGLKTPQAKGVMIGFNDVHTRNHVYRAIIEGLGYALFEGLENLMHRTKNRISRVAVAGGGSQSESVCRIMTDIMGLPVYKVQTYETSGLGCAIVAFTSLGVYRDMSEATAHMVRVSEEYIPDAANHERYMQFYNRVYKKIYRCNLPIYNELYSLLAADRY